eukprot:20078-Pleurochrysis_carterae.AAC.1
MDHAAYMGPSCRHSCSDEWDYTSHLQKDGNSANQASWFLQHISLYTCKATASVMATKCEIGVPTLLSTRARRNLTAASLSTVKGRRRLVATLPEDVEEKGAATRTRTQLLRPTNVSGNSARGANKAPRFTNG